MRGPFLFPALAGQTVVAFRVCEPWAAALPPTEDPAPLFGAIVLGCNRHALLCHSPVRHLGNPQGSKIGLHGGGTAELPFRASLCEAEDLEYWLPLTGGAHWSHCASPVLPTPGEALAEAPQMVRDGDSGPWQLEFRFRTGRCFRLQYRPDMDASLQFAPVEVGYSLNRVEIMGPEEDFGWLHPLRLRKFVVDGVLWESAKVWPIQVLRANRESADPQGFFRHTWRNALRAYFKQCPPSYRRRLIELRYPVQVQGIPAGVIEEVAEELRQESRN
ncbi:hypothetical protein [Rhodoferax fermentans]|uniref:Uncharacterized protein n=1 Tax=Rhodoferax fermentans TaxID=28066 RepID=A0A1T1ARI2_RHOFE|nr:hypothetical protein [Rhodoferax fermentans]MBK1683215.1 hypothetical protein [Rhodoferax fermentans]OOV06710.1 hypothetical protein RF819_08210 [Rhodoferax fermentans]